MGEREERRGERCGVGGMARMCVRYKNSMWRRLNAQHYPSTIRVYNIDTSTYGKYNYEHITDQS